MLEFTEKNDNIILAVLFALNGPGEAGQIAKACDWSAEKVKEEIELISERLKSQESAILIKEINGKYQLATNPIYFENIVNVVSSPKKPQLTDTMLETLAIVSQKGETTRVEIEKIRGVKSDFAVNKLVEYGLIEEKGRMNLPGRPMIFGPTDEFYRRFGVDKDNPIPQVSRDMEEIIASDAKREAKGFTSDG